MEGEKSVLELLHSPFKIHTIFTTKEWAEAHLQNVDIEIELAEQSELKPISFFSTPSPVVALVEMMPDQAVDYKSGQWYLALDSIKDPGNLGTLIRIADWYGISTIICSSDTVDQYNPKTISSTMGSFARVSMIYGDLTAIIGESSLPVYLAEMDGEPLANGQKFDPGIIVIGSESHGVGAELKSLNHKSISIRRIGEAESLNASVAAGIICDRLIQPNKL